MNSFDCKERLLKKYFYQFNDLNQKPDYLHTQIENINSNHETYKFYNSIEKVSLLTFIKMELTRGYQLEHDKDRFSAQRDKIYSFIKIPKEVEKFMIYGFFQCADSLLFLYTYLPVRFLMAILRMLTRIYNYYLRISSKKTFEQNKIFLQSAEKCDLLKGIVIAGSFLLTWKTDTSMMYHLVKSQSVIKLYIFYNMLEVGDRLSSAFGQDTIDSLLWTASEPRAKFMKSNSKHHGIVLHLFIAFLYVILHSILVLFQATTLNVAINSNNKALLTIMMSNNFVELKGSVFKKFDKNNLFQLSCSDIRERFHLTMLLLLVTLQTMKEYAWRADRLAVLLPDIILLIVAEIIVDWVKHAFITRFNELSMPVYQDYIVTLAYDVAQTRQITAYSDPSDLVARRMGLIPLPLGVAIAKVISTTMPVSSKPAYIILLFTAYLILTSFRILLSMTILGLSSDLIEQHRQLIRNKENDQCYSLENISIKIQSNSHFNILDPKLNIAMIKLSNSVASLTDKEVRKAAYNPDHKNNWNNLELRHNLMLNRSKSQPSLGTK